MHAEVLGGSDVSTSEVEKFAPPTASANRTPASLARTNVTSAKCYSKHANMKKQLPNPCNLTSTLGLYNAAHKTQTTDRVSNG